MGAEALSRKQRRKMAKSGMAMATTMQATGRASEAGQQEQQDREAEQRARGGDEAAAREAPFQAPSLSRAQLVKRVEALELQARQLAQRKASNEDQKKHAELL